MATLWNHSQPKICLNLQNKKGIEGEILAQAGIEVIETPICLNSSSGRSRQNTLNNHRNSLNRLLPYFIRRAASKSSFLGKHSTGLPCTSWIIKINQSALYVQNLDAGTGYSLRAGSLSWHFLPHHQRFAENLQNFLCNGRELVRIDLPGCSLMSISAGIYEVITIAISPIT